MHWEFVAAGYGLAIAGIAVYARWVLQRGKALSVQVSEEKRRFFG